MTLIIEDGSTPAGANSYVSLNDARVYADARGVDLSTVDATLEAQILESMDYFESYTERFVGDQSDRDQPLSWPRDNVIVEGWSWTNTEIPDQVVSALLAIIVEIHEGESHLNPAAVTLPKISEKTDCVVDVKYADPLTPLKVNKTFKSTSMINILLKNSGRFAVRT